MSENYDDKDIEKLIFGGGLASSEIEPSEKFWNRAYEDILQRENHANNNRVSRWRGAFYIMSTVVLLMGCYAIYMHYEVSGIKEQLANIESTQINNKQQNINQSTITNSTVKSSTNNSLVSTNLGKNITQPNTTPVVTSKSENTLTNKENKITYSRLNNPSGRQTAKVINISPTGNNNQSVTPNNNTGAANGLTNEITTPPVANSASNITQPAINNSTPAENNGSVSKSLDGTTSPINANATSSTISNNNKSSVPAQSSPTQNTNIALSGKAPDSMAKSSVLDSSNVNLPYISKNPITFKRILSKMSLSASYAPGITDDFLNDKNNDPTNTITADMLKTQQDGDGTFAVGLRLAYDISDKWTIQTGCYYSKYTYNINSTIIYPQLQENGQLGYSITTSSGTVFLPSSTVPAHLGDSIKVRGSSSRGYINIPLQVKYRFIAGNKLNFYVTGGFSLNIANYKETEIHWENTALQEGDVSIPSIYGLNTVQYSYNFGLGAEYLIGKGLSIYTEPYFDGAFTSINKNTPVITYPFFFGLALGVKYHF